MPTSHADHDLWQREQDYLSKKRKESPELFLPVPKDPFDLLNRIGITSHPPTLPKGYIKYSPLDFIVEEVGLDGGVVTVDGEHAHAEPDGAGTVYADLVKVGISTLDAAQRVADALKCDIQKVGYAGIKDALALTGQRISLRGASLEAVQSLSVPGCLIGHVKESKGVLTPGSLTGNRFTLLIRTEHPIDDADFGARMKRLSEKGVMNYYGPQRFGTPRFLAHVFGMHILRGDFAGLVRAYLTMTSPYEYRLATEIREKAAACYGDWKAMDTLFEELPYAFRQERTMIEAMMKGGPNAEMNAINALSGQAKMWVQAYSSFLVNHTLAEAEASGKPIAEKIPIAVNNDPAALSFYKTWFEKHGIRNHIQTLKKFSFISIDRPQTVPTVIRPTVHGYKIIDEGVIVSFDLPKGAYATTVLMYLFETMSGHPVPEWVKRTEHDTKQLLGTGNLTNVRERLAEYFAAAMQQKNEEAEG